VDIIESTLARLQCVETLTLHLPIYMESIIPKYYELSNWMVAEDLFESLAYREHMSRLQVIELKLEASCEDEPCCCTGAELAAQLDKQRFLFNAVDSALAKVCRAPARYGQLKRIDVLLKEESNISDRQLAIRMFPGLFPEMRALGYLNVLQD
jgi:hypothetical protein